jgi:large subunit ribosomal protein L31
LQAVKIKRKVIKMKKGIHPANYRTVAFKDMSNGHVYITKSTVNTRETEVIDGVEYPVVKLEISSSSHPFYTGKMKLVDSAGRVDKFNSRYQKHLESRKK